jgi:hypothetical protein
VAELTIAELLLKLLTEWRSITKPRQLDLLRLCNRKYEELEQTHATFMHMLREVRDLIEKSARDRGLGNEDPGAPLRRLEDKRSEGRASRLARHQQASLYADGAFADQRSVLKTVPQPIVDAVQSVMRSYAEYFESGGAYDHELGRIILDVHLGLAQLSGDAEVGEALHRGLLEKIERADKALELSWVRFSRDYYRAYATFADHGIFVKDKGSDNVQGKS